MLGKRTVAEPQMLLSRQCKKHAGRNTVMNEPAKKYAQYPMVNIILILRGESGAWMA